MVSPNLRTSKAVEIIRGPGDLICGKPRHEGSSACSGTISLTKPASLLRCKHKAGEEEQVAVLE